MQLLHTAVSEILCYCLVPCRICTTLTARIRCPRR